MDLVIFMGHHKVGSSSLQRYLARNWLTLAQAGILYPAVEMEGLARNLAQALGRPAPKALPAINVREPHNAYAFKLMAEIAGREVPPWHEKLPSTLQMTRAIRQQAAALSPRAIVLCSEVFANFGPMAPAHLRRLQRLFPKARVRILCTLRRPDQYLASWHGQRMKFGHKVAPLRGGALDHYFEGVHFDYRRMLAPWFEHFEGADFVLRDYREVLAAGGSVADFRAVSGLSFPAGLEEVENANPSLPLAAMEIARRGNHDLPAPVAAGLRKRLIAAGERLSFAPNGDVEMFGPENRRRLAERFAPIDAWLGGKAGRKRFFADGEQVAQLRPVPEMEAAREALRQLRRDPQMLLGKPEQVQFLRGLDLG